MTGSRPRLLKLAPMLIGVLVFAASCASNAPQDTFKPEGPQARKIDTLIMPVFGIAGVVFVLILGGALWISIKFKARDEDDFEAGAKQIHGNFQAEIGWTIFPAIVLAIVGAFTVATIFDLAKEPKEDALHVDVIGQQWWWEYRYDIDGDGTYDEIITANDLVIPAGREIALNMKSRDVIHSFWVPRLQGKKDAVPGRSHPLTMQADKPGEYFGQCAEFCGLSHAEMRIKVVAMDADDFDAWAANQMSDFEAPREEAASAGWAAFAGQCTSCHELTGMTDPTDTEKIFEYPDKKNQVSQAAPNLAHFMSRATFAGAKFDLRKDTKECRDLGQNWGQTDEGIEKCLNRTDLEAWLRNAPSMKAMYAGDVMSPASRGMPNFNLSEDQINDLVAFLTTLK